MAKIGRALKKSQVECLFLGSEEGGKRKLFIWIGLCEAIAQHICEGNKKNQKKFGI